MLLLSWVESYHRGEVCWFASFYYIGRKKEGKREEGQRGASS